MKNNLRLMNELNYIQVRKEIRTIRDLLLILLCALVALAYSMFLN